MLIVCPNCATSYMLDPASVGPAGRPVRCARCKTTWFAGAPETAATPLSRAENEADSDPNVSAIVDRLIAEAKAESGRSGQDASLPPQDQAWPLAGTEDNPAADRFGAESVDPPAHRSWADADPTGFGDLGRNSDLVSHDDEPLFPGDSDRHTGQDFRGGDFPLADAPSLVPSIGQDPLFDDGHIENHDRSRANDDKEDVESFAARREKLRTRRQKSKRSSRWTAAILVLFAFNIALIGARGEVVRYLPQTASLFAAIGLPVNLRHLRFDKVRITKESSDGVNILFIEGMIENTADKPTEVPRLRFAARNATGQDVYTWSALPTRSILGPKESEEFHSRLAAPPADATDVMVRFFTPQDAVNGLSGGGLSGGQK
jgi:predicted Zn finger-like uncharacterized protein